MDYIGFIEENKNDLAKLFIAYELVNRYNEVKNLTNADISTLYDIYIDSSAPTICDFLDAVCDFIEDRSNHKLFDAENSIVDFKYFYCDEFEEWL